MRVYFDTDEDVMQFKGEDLILVCLDSEDEDSIFSQNVCNYSTNDGYFVLLVTSHKLLHCKIRQDNCSELCGDFTLLYSFTRKIKRHRAELVSRNIMFQ